MRSVKWFYFKSACNDMEKIYEFPVVYRNSFVFPCRQIDMTIVNENSIGVRHPVFILNTLTENTENLRGCSFFPWASFAVSCVCMQPITANNIFCTVHLMCQNLHKADLALDFKLLLNLFRAPSYWLPMF